MNSIKELSHYMRQVDFLIQVKKLPGREKTTKAMISLWKTRNKEIPEDIEILARFLVADFKSQQSDNKWKSKHAKQLRKYLKNSGNSRVQKATKTMSPLQKGSS